MNADQKTRLVTLMRDHGNRLTAAYQQADKAPPIARMSADRRAELVSDAQVLLDGATYVEANMPTD